YGDERSCCSRRSCCRSDCWAADNRKLKATLLSCCSGLMRPRSNCARAIGCAVSLTGVVRAESTEYIIRSLEAFCLLPDAARKKTAQPIRITVRVAEPKRAEGLFNIRISLDPSCPKISRLQNRFSVPQQGCIPKLLRL